MGFRKGSDLCDALNEFFASSYADGTMMTIAETYGVQAAIIRPVTGKVRRCPILRKAEGSRPLLFPAFILLRRAGTRPCS